MEQQPSVRNSPAGGNELRPVVVILGESVRREMPHPRGEIKVHLARNAGGYSASVDLPDGVSGDFVWKGERRELRAGRNKLE